MFHHFSAHAPAFYPMIQSMVSYQKMPCLLPTYDTPYYDNSYFVTDNVYCSDAMGDFSDEADEAFLAPPSPSSPQFIQVNGCTYFPAPSEDDVNDDGFASGEVAQYEYEDDFYGSNSIDEFSNEADEAFLAPPSPTSHQLFQMGGCTYFPAPLEDEEEKEDNDEDVDSVEEECEEECLLRPIEQLLQQHDTPCFLRGFRPAQLRDHDEPALSDDEVNSLLFLTLTRPQGEDQYILTEEEIDDFVAKQLRNTHETSGCK